MHAQDVCAQSLWLYCLTGRICGLIVLVLYVCMLHNRVQPAQLATCSGRLATSIGGFDSVSSTSVKFSLPPETF